MITAIIVILVIHAVFANIAIHRLHKQTQRQEKANTRLQTDLFTFKNTQVKCAKCGRFTIKGIVFDKQVVCPKCLIK